MTIQDRPTMRCLSMPDSISHLAADLEKAQGRSKNPKNTLLKTSSNENLDDYFISEIVEEERQQTSFLPTFSLTSRQSDSQLSATTESIEEVMEEHEEEEQDDGGRRETAQKIIMELATLLDTEKALSPVSVVDHERTRTSTLSKGSRYHSDDSLDSRLFTRLESTNRSTSLPIPRKPSLKRIDSALSNKSLKRNVSFGKLETREFNIALSDHPSCSFGPPIQLGWEFKDLSTVSLDDYEKVRSPRRSPHQMVLSYNMRRYLLLKRAGYSKDEIKEAMSEVDRVKRERTVTEMFLPVHKIDETLEEVLNRFKSVFS